MSINQLLEQAQTAYDTADWSSLSQYLQMILGEDSEQPEQPNREHLLELAQAVLAFGDFQQRWDVVKVFNRLGRIAIAPLTEILADEDADEELRWYVARILGELKNPEAIAPLVELIKTNESEELRMMAASALGQIGQHAIAALTELLVKDDTRLLAVRSLSYIREEAIITPLLSVVQDSQVAVRATAIEALSSFHNTRVPPVLLNALDDVAAPVRKEAVQGLGFRRYLRSELDLVTRLQPRLDDLNEGVCCAAAIALSRMGCDAAACSLFQVLMLPHTPLKLQLEIIRALCWVETLSGLEYLQQAMNQLQSLTLWQEIVTVLGRVQQPQLATLATKILLEMLQTKHPAVEIATVRSAIALSLGQLGKMQAVQPLTEMLADEDDSVRLHAIAALKNLTPEAR